MNFQSILLVKICKDSLPCQLLARAPTLVPLAISLVVFFWLKGEEDLEPHSCKGLAFLWERCLLPKWWDYLDLALLNIHCFEVWKGEARLFLLGGTCLLWGKCLSSKLVIPFFSLHLFGQKKWTVMLSMRWSLVSLHHGGGLEFTSGKVC